MCAPYGGLRVSQADSDDPDVGNHHRFNTEYDQVFHLLLLIDEIEDPGSGARLCWMPPDMDDPIGRKCSRSMPYSRGLLS